MHIYGVSGENMDMKSRAFGLRASHVFSSTENDIGRCKIRKQSKMYNFIGTICTLCNPQILLRVNLEKNCLC